MIISYFYSSVIHEINEQPGREIFRFSVLQTKQVPPTVRTNYLWTHFMLYGKVRPNIILDLGFNDGVILTKPSDLAPFFTKQTAVEILHSSMLTN